MNLFYGMLTLTVIYSTPILVTALGGMFCEKSGVVNIGLEGLMGFGAFAGATVMYYVQGSGSGPYVALLVGMVVGGVVSVLHAYMCITLRSNQVISGTAINMFAIGVTIYLSQIIFGQQRTIAFSESFTKTTYPLVSSIPIIGPILFSNIYPTVYIALLLVALSWYILYKTSFGLRLRAAGENPHAVDSVGANVTRIRYIAVILSGLFSGLGGAMMILTQDIQYTSVSIHGTGFIALAAVIFGRWKPVPILGASLFFGFSQVLKIYSSNLGIFSRLPLEFFDSFPYILTIIALVVFSGKGMAPRSSGVPYDKGQR